MIASVARMRVGALLVAAGLSACGGGGGGGDASPPPGAPAAVTGLVPTAPALGITLYSDATALRPLIAEGVWSYRGVETRSDASVPTTVYDNVIAQQAAAGGAVTETATNVDNTGLAEQTVSVRAGEVHVSSLQDLGDGQSQVVDQLELRSPVRVGDQYIVLDRRTADTGVDVEGDGKIDVFDFAVYSRVIGEEYIDLVSYPQLRTVRVQTVVLARFRLSSTGAFTETLSGTSDTWYAQGVGPVKRATDVPGAAAGSRVLTSETLVNWDGVNKGIGFLTPKPAVTSTGTRLQYVIGAVSFDTHALMMNFAGTFASRGIALSQVDARGALVSTTSYADINAARARLVRVGGAARVVAMDDSGLYMYSYDAVGNATSSGPVLLRAGGTTGTATNEEFIAGAEGNTLWIAWVQVSDDPMAATYDLRAQPFDAAGQPKAPPFVLARVSTPMAISRLQVDGATGHVIFAWDENQSGTWSKRYALVVGQDALTPTLHTIGPTDGVVPVMRAVATAQGSTLLWLSSFDLGPARLSGVTFNTLGEPLWATASNVETENLLIPWLPQPQYFLAGGGAHLDTFAQNYDPLESSVSVVTELTPGGGPLATNDQARLLARGVFPGNAAVVGLSGKVLVFADDGAGVTVTSVWRRP